MPGLNISIALSTREFIDQSGMEFAGMEVDNSNFEGATMHARQTLFAFFFMFMLTSAFLIAPAGFGQANTGTITGTVRDPSGAVIAGANVAVKNMATGAQRTAQSGNQGQYEVPGLPVGTYEVDITSGNFAPFKTNAEVTVGGVSPVDAQLSTGQATTTVGSCGGRRGGEHANSGALADCNPAADGGTAEPHT